MEEAVAKFKNEDHHFGDKMIWKLRGLANYNDKV